MEQKTWEGCQALCTSDPTSQDSTNRLVRRWVGDEDIGQKRNHIEVELRHLILVKNLLAPIDDVSGTSISQTRAQNRVGVWGVVLGHALTVDQAPHEGAEQHEDQGMQKQTEVAGDAVSRADPAAKQAAGHLEGLGVRNQEKHDKGHNLLAPVNVHLVLLKKKLI